MVVGEVDTGDKTLLVMPMLELVILVGFFFQLFFFFFSYWWGISSVISTHIKYTLNQY